MRKTWSTARCAVGERASVSADEGSPAGRIGKG
jgi:hypothetical protein